MGQCSPEEAILATDNTNLYFLPASHSDGPPAELLANGKWTELMSKLHESFDLILVDAPPILNLADVELIAPACDGLVMVVRAGHVRREVLEKSAKQLDPKRFLGLVYNGADGAYYPRYYYGS
jgi:Mrp family chromosome partitioning ATPase